MVIVEEALLVYVGLIEEAAFRGIQEGVGGGSEETGFGAVLEPGGLATMAFFLPLSQ